MTNDFVKKFFSHEDVQALSAENFSENELFNVPDGQSYNVARLAFTFFKQKKYSQAQIIYEGLICANPLEPSYHVILGLIYYKTEQVDLALAQFAEAVDLDPDCNAAHVARAFLIMEQRDLESASNDEQPFN
ncbi:tetratricopeptide repeat protein [bacterium]|nr:tetratricopeptide repeat protein [bacterium]